MSTFRELRQAAVVTLFVLASGCDAKIPEPVPVESPPAVSPTLNPTEKEFIETINYYEKGIVTCLNVEINGDPGGDIAKVWLEKLKENPDLFENIEFSQVWNWFFDDIKTYCSENSIDDPIKALIPMNDLISLADQEYFQYQRQAKYGYEIKDLEMIESAFTHREQAHEYMEEASYYYEALFEIY